MQNITSHGAVLTNLRPTMTRMTGATTPPISISPCTLRLICIPCTYRLDQSIEVHGELSYQCYVNLTNARAQRQCPMTRPSKMKLSPPSPIAIVSAPPSRHPLHCCRHHLLILCHRHCRLPLLLPPFMVIAIALLLPSCSPLHHHR
jgi:hypothetical protein